MIPLEICYKGREWIKCITVLIMSLAREPVGRPGLKCKERAVIQCWSICFACRRFQVQPFASLVKWIRKIISNVKDCSLRPPRVGRPGLLASKRDLGISHW